MSSLVELFHRLHNFNELIRWGGHAALVAIVFSETGIMAGFFLPGDSLLVTSGLFAAAGHLNLYRLLIELSLAAIAGDQLSYFIGQKLGPTLFNKEHSFFFHKDHLRRAQVFYEKYGNKTIVLARFVPVVRTFAPVVAGVGRMSYRRFLFYNVAGGTAWVFSMVLTGYWLGRSIPHIDLYIDKILLVIIFLSILPIVWQLWAERRAPKAGPQP